jgi:hypothetical protein
MDIPPRIGATLSSDTASASSTINPPQQSRTMLLQLVNLWCARQAQLQQSDQPAQQSTTQDFVQQTSHLSQNTIQAAQQRSNLMDSQGRESAAEGPQQKVEVDEDETEDEVMQDGETEDEVYEGIDVKREAK